ncbi:MAG TPA: hypothetical protein VFG20_17720 [Planctomycetaceae bacterium]|nr:hypothetical protein [Planctomycetaceae bacterium]
MIRGSAKPLPLFFAALIAVTLGGCSLGVMAGKMFKGEPLRTAEFHSMTGIDLGKGKHRIAVVCSTPASVESDLTSLNFDLIDGITRKMKVHGVDVVDPDVVAKWIDDSGGVVTDPAAMVNAFDADFVAWIDIDTFSLQEDDTKSKLLRGRTNGFVRVFKAQEVGDSKTALTAFNSEFTSIFPSHQPISELSRTKLSFQKEYIDRLCSELAVKFYDHRPGENF